MLSYRSFDPNTMSSGSIYDILVGVIQPRPIAFVSTLDKQGRPNLAPFSFYIAGGSNPPSLAFSVTTSTANQHKDTLRNILETREFVVNSVHPYMTEGMNASSYSFAPGVSEWEAAMFTPVLSDVVRPPRVGESRAHFECRLYQHVPHGEGVGSANYVIGEIVRMHVAEEALLEGRINPEMMRTLARLGGPSYLDSEALRIFSLQRPSAPPPEEL